MGEADPPPPSLGGGCVAAAPAGPCAENSTRGCERGALLASTQARASAGEPTPPQLCPPALALLLFGSRGEVGASLFGELHVLILSPPFFPNQSLAAFLSGEQGTKCDLNHGRLTCLPAS